MIGMPDFDLMYEFETNFHLTMDKSRLGKLLAHYQAYQMAREVPGAIVECGVFKGTSLIRFAQLRELFDSDAAVRIIGFDTFGDIYPDTKFEEDLVQRTNWIAEAGESSISKEQMAEVFAYHKIKNFELVEGDVLKTLPAYKAENPQLKISLLNIDIDFVEPTLCVLENLFSRVSAGGVILLDNYGAFHGDTKGVDDFFENQPVSIHRFPYVSRPCYIIKE